jgi:hypothetical protein
LGRPGRFIEKIRQNLPAVAYRAKSLGKSLCDGCDMPKVAPTIARIATIGEFEAELWQNPPDLENQLLHLWMLYCTDRSFATGNFSKGKRARDH